MEASLLRHDWLNYWPLAVDLNSSPSPLPGVWRERRVGTERANPLITWLVVLATSLCPWVGPQSHLPWSIFLGTEDRRPNIIPLFLAFRKFQEFGGPWARNYGCVMAMRMASLYFPCKLQYDALASAVQSILNLREGRRCCFSGHRKIPTVVKAQMMPLVVLMERREKQFPKSIKECWCDGTIVFQTKEQIELFFHVKS